MIIPTGHCRACGAEYVLRRAGARAPLFDPICERCIVGFETWLDRNPTYSWGEDSFTIYVAQKLSVNAHRVARERPVDMCEGYSKDGVACLNYATTVVDGREVCRFHAWQLRMRHRPQFIENIVRQVAERVCEEIREQPPEPKPIPPPTPKPVIDDKRMALTLKQTAAALSISTQTVYRLIKSGKLKAIKPHGRRLVTADSIREILK